MAVRTSMAELIARVRGLIGDPACPAQNFEDQTVQDFLDRTQLLVRYELLTTVPDIVPQGATNAQFNWAMYVSSLTDWEADVVIQGRNGAQAWFLITPVSSDLQVGKWTFDVTLPTISTIIPAQFPPVFATGKTYDPYLAAAYLLELWSAFHTDSYDFATEGKTFKRSQRFSQRQTLAQTYRRMAKPRTIHLWRSDLQASCNQQPMRLFGATNDTTG